MDERDIMRQAFQALLRGDTAERDRLLRPLVEKRQREIREAELRQPVITMTRAPNGTFIMSNREAR